MTDLAPENDAVGPVPVDPKELTLFVVPRGDMPAVTAWLEQWRSQTALHGARIVVLHGPTDTAVLPAVRETLEPAEVVEVPSDEGEGREAAFALLEQLLVDTPTRFVAVTRLSRVGSRALEILERQLALSHGRALALELEAPGDMPLLLPTSSGSSLFAQVYLGAWLARSPELEDASRSYLASIALAHGNNVVEGIDPVPAEGAIEVFARAALGRMYSEPPPWSYEIGLFRSGTNELLARVPAELSQRIDNAGRRRWEDLRAVVPLAGLPEGNYRVMLIVPSENEAIRPRRLMRARPGVTAPARTVFLPGQGDSPASRYLVHTRGRDQHTWLTLQHGASPADDRRWNRALVRKDLGLVLRGRSAGYRMRLARLVRLITRPFFAKRDIWLVGERVDTAQDNGMHLFRHLRTAHPERDVYYVIDRKSPHAARVAELGNVVQHSSLRHQLLMMHASVLANAYSINHMVPRQWPLRAYTQHLAWRVGALRVYLKHGVNVSANTVKRGTGGYDLYLSVNPRETAALRESSRYGDHVRETGMPRYDALEKAPSTRTILFMPTWRRYLVPKLFGGDDEVAKVPFEGSTYERFLRGFLHSPRLHEVLERFDYRLQFLPHYNLAQYLEDFELSSPRTVRADTATQTFGELLGGCDAFVTDHSSVHFDVAYLGTPVVYAHFDPDEYAEGHASVSWFEHERDGFGPVVGTVEETIDALEEILERGCTMDPSFAARVDAAFTFRDHGNCARVVAAIQERLSRLSS